MNLNDFLQSKRYSRLLASLGILLVALIVFAAGIIVGYRKAEFSYRWSNNYYRNFGGPSSPFGLSDADDNALSPHGAFGTVIGVNLPSFAVRGPDEAEKIVIIGPQTVIRSMRNPATTSDIRTGQSVIIIGEPDEQGQIDASFVRIVPPPPSSASTTITP